jgi:rhodanese-related sulfurtransferase
MKAFFGLFVFLIFGIGALYPVHANTENIVVVDVRTTDEFNTSHVKGAMNVDIMDSTFKDQILKLDKSKTYKVYCKSGKRAARALQMMKDLGFKDIENLGGLKEAVKKLNKPCEGKESC